MNWVIESLRHFADWLESRRKPVNFAMFVRVDEHTTAIGRMHVMIDVVTNELNKAKAEIEKLKVTVENLSLRTGLGRSIPTIGGRK